MSDNLAIVIVVVAIMLSMTTCSVTNKVMDDRAAERDALHPQAQETPHD